MAELTTDKFVSLLREFNELIKDQPQLKEVKDKLLEIKQSAINSNTITGRQKEAITARCDNYIDGTYGRSLSHSSKI